MYGKEIKYSRTLKGATQIEVSNATGLPQNTISWIECDKGIPNIYQCIALANYYDISLDELVGRESIGVSLPRSDKKSEIQEVYDELDELEQAQVLSFARTLAKYKKSSELSKKTNRNIS